MSTKQTLVEQIEESYGISVIGEGPDFYLGEDSRAYHFFDAHEQRLLLPKDALDLEVLQDEDWVVFYE